MTVNILVNGNLAASDGGGMLAGAFANYDFLVESTTCAGECIHASGEIRSTTLGGSRSSGIRPAASSS